MYEQLLQRERDSDDPVAIGRYLTDAYGTNLRVRVLACEQGRRPHLTHRRIGADGFALERVTHDGEVEVQGEQPRVIVLWTINGVAQSRWSDERVVAAPGEVILGSAGRGPFEIRTHNSQLCTAVLDGTLLERAAADRGVGASGRAGPPRFEGGTPVTTGAMRAWMRTYLHVRDTVLADDSVATPLVVAAAGRLLAATTLSLFPTVDLLGDDDGVSDQPAALRRVIAYMEEHAGDDIGVADIAASVYLTPRAVQYMFRRHLETTPMGYLRRIRLDRVHRELLSGKRGDVTVSSVAARWGFAHTGRFAVLYRRTYGRSPHITLRE